MNNHPASGSARRRPDRASPIDRLTPSPGHSPQVDQGRANPGTKIGLQKRLPNRPRAGTFRIHVRKLAGEHFTRVTVQIHSSGTPVYLTGIRATESRPGFWTLQIPSLEHWATGMRQLSALQRERMTEPQFYASLQNAITKRLGVA